jgi:hypothetical protein
MTYSNYAEAKLTLYDNGVLPLTKDLYECLARVLYPRFKMDTTRFTLFYDENEIPALAPRRDDAIKKKKDTGVLTIDELRGLQGYAPLEEGAGAVLYQPAMLIPVGAPTPVPASTLPSAGQKTTREKFITILSSELDFKGARIYSDAEILEMADKRGL